MNIATSPDTQYKSAGSIPLTGRTLRRRPVAASSSNGGPSAPPGLGAASIGARSGPTKAFSEFLTKQLGGSARFADIGPNALQQFAGAAWALGPLHMFQEKSRRWVARWAALLAVAAQRAFASSLLELPLAGESNGDDAAPELHEVLADGRWDRPPPASRVPPRR